MAGPQRFTTTLVSDRRKRVLIPVPFDPDAAWGHKPEHHVHGTVNGMGVRGVIEPLDDGRGLVLGAAWRRDCGLAAGDRVDVVLEPEGPSGPISTKTSPSRSTPTPRQRRSSTPSPSSTGAPICATSTRPSAARRNGSGASRKS